MGYPRSLSVNLKKVLRNAALAGRIYSVSFGTGTTTATTAAGLSLFNAATARKFIVIEATGFNQTSVQNVALRMTTTDPALGTTPTIVNNMPGGPSSLATVSSATAAAGAPGTLKRLITASTNSGSESEQSLFRESDYIILPAGLSNGVIITVGSSATGNVITAHLVWAEI